MRWLWPADSPLLIIFVHCTMALPCAYTLLAHNCNKTKLYQPFLRHGKSRSCKIQSLLAHIHPIAWDHWAQYSKRNMYPSGSPFSNHHTMCNHYSRYTVSSSNIDMLCVRHQHSCCIIQNDVSQVNVKNTWQPFRQPSLLDMARAVPQARCNMPGLVQKWNTVQRKSIWDKIFNIS